MRKSKKLRVLCFAAAALVLAAVLIAALSVRFFSASHAPLLFVQNGTELWLADLALSPPRLRQLEADAPGQGLRVQYGPDGAYVAYAEEFEGSATLYLRKTASGESASVFNRAADFLLLDGGKLLYTDDSGALYLAVGKKAASLLDEGVERFWADKAREHVFWLRTGAEGKELFSLRPGRKEDPLLLAAGFDSFAASPDGQSYAFLYGDVLRSRWRFSEPEEIDDGVSALGCVLDSGEVWYERALNDTVRYSDLVDDDLSLSDAARFGAAGGPEAVEAARTRETLREMLRSTQVSDRFSELRRADRKGNTELIGAGSLLPAGTVAGSAVTWRSIETDPKQITMSELYARYAETGDLEQSLFRNTLRVFSLAPSSAAGYYLCPEQDGELWELYRYSLSRGADRAELLSERVQGLVLLTGSDVFYFADPDGENAALCRGDATLEQSAYAAFWMASGDRFCCFTGWDPEAGSGTLHYYDGKRLHTVAENASARHVTLLPDGCCFTTGSGSASESDTLHIFSGGAPAVAGEDVSAYYAVDGGRLAWLSGDRLFAAGGTELAAGVDRICVPEERASE